MKSGVTKVNKNRPNAANKGCGFRP
jgi:hypothetical protein